MGSSRRRYIGKPNDAAINSVTRLDSCEQHDHRASEDDHRGGEPMSGTLGALHLIEQTAARLCRALNGSVVRLNEALSAQARDETAILEAAKRLTNQVTLLEAAWGPADQPVSLHQLACLAQGLPDHIAVNLSALAPAVVFPASLARIVLNILLLAADSLPEGGQIMLAGTPEDLFIRIEGPGAAWPTGMAICLADEAETRSALTDGRYTQMALTIQLAHTAHIRLSALFASHTQSEPAILRLGR